MTHGQTWCLEKLKEFIQEPEWMCTGFLEDEVTSEFLKALKNISAAEELEIVRRNGLYIIRRPEFFIELINLN